MTEEKFSRGADSAENVKLTTASLFNARERKCERSEREARGAGGGVCEQSEQEEIFSLLTLAL